MLTRRGASSLSAILIFSFVGWLSGNPTLTIASLTLVLIFLIETVRFQIGIRAVKQLNVERVVTNSTIEVEKRIDVTLRISNPTNRSTGYVIVNDNLPPALAVESGMPRTTRITRDGETRISYFITALQMGDYEIGDLYLIAVDALGFHSHTVCLPIRTKVEVYPRLRVMYTRGTIQAIRTAIIGQKPVSETGPSSDFRGIREYYPGDDFKHIAWKKVATSSRHSLMTREFEANRTLNVVFALHEKLTLLDGPVGHRKLDHIVEGIIAATYTGAHESDRITFVFDGSARLLANPGHGKEQQVIYAIKSTYNIQPQQTEPLRTLTATLLRTIRQRSLIVVITDTENYDPNDFQALGQLARSHIVHVIVLRNSPILPIPEPKDSTVKLGYDVILGYEQDTVDRFANDCERLGLHLKVCTPHEFLETVFQIYIDAKKKGVIRV